VSPSPPIAWGKALYATSSLYPIALITKPTIFVASRKWSPNGKSYRKFFIRISAKRGLGFRTAVSFNPFKLSCKVFSKLSNEEGKVDQFLGVTKSIRRQFATKPRFVSIRVHSRFTFSPA